MGYHLGVDLGTTFTAAAASDGGNPTMVGPGQPRAADPVGAVFPPRRHTCSSARPPSSAAGRTRPGRSGSSSAASVTRCRSWSAAGRSPRRRSAPGCCAGWSTRRPSSSASRRWTSRSPTRRTGRSSRSTCCARSRCWPTWKRCGPARNPRPRPCNTHPGPGWRPATGSPSTTSAAAPSTSACWRKPTTGFRILGRPEGIEHLGGIDFDEAVFRRVVDQLPPVGIDADSEDDAGADRRVGPVAAGLRGGEGSTVHRRRGRRPGRPAAHPDLGAG